ncbi:erythromycin esterase-domain-containing protein [Hypoxylon trugodes]|uniref:erythromycin esterase-domain-containing protein n=1 Tax=Hypoxylon trugodes TaxID=326681 RepID=UPI00219ABEC7|nr:erythromycin esterase-domain-containing protein [Hypoxylon trugodes]KAI1391593.1 erythromycin esterase-domain-containing protein [Hypoxylon trugodes]
MQKLKTKILELSRIRQGSNSDNGASVCELLQNEVHIFPSVEEASDVIKNCFNSFGDCKVLLIGDATHGTSEFYKMRAEITKFMIEQHGFNIVAIEADWAETEAIDRYVRHRPASKNQASIRSSAPGAVEPPDCKHVFARFPTWMWQNEEVNEFVEWLRNHNKNKDEHDSDSVGFYGLDLYSLGASMHAVIEYLDKMDKSMAGVARERYGKLMEWADSPKEYGLETLVSSFQGYEAEVVDMLKSLLSKRHEYSQTVWNGEEFHSSEQNARVVKDAEQYYKAIFYGRHESWNLRDKHMFDALVHILDHRGESSKAVLWAHNSHVGDARASSKSWSRKELNIGQLCKEAFGTRALTIGCSTYWGTVAAAEQWDHDMRVMRVEPALPGSYEELMRATGIKNFVLNLQEGRCNKKLREALREERLQRFIGVIYEPATERQSHYSISILPEQYDSFIWFEETRHVQTLETRQPPTGLGPILSWPFGF